MPKKPTKVKQLETDLAAARAMIGDLNVRIDNLEAQRVGLLAGEGKRSEEISALSSKVHNARMALQPFKDKTDKWPSWPDPNIAAVAPLTFGDIQRARDAAIALQ